VYAIHLNKLQYPGHIPDTTTMRTRHSSPQHIHTPHTHPTTTLNPTPKKPQPFVYKQTLPNFTMTASNSQQRTMQPGNVNLRRSDCRARTAPATLEPLTTGRDSERTMLQTDNDTSCSTQLNALPHHGITASCARQQYSCTWELSFFCWWEFLQQQCCTHC